MPMYKMKAIYGTSNVVEEYPTCMYKINNIHGDKDLAIDDPELLALINQQEELLKDLEKLKDEVYQMGNDIGINNQREPLQVPGRVANVKDSVTLPEPESCHIVIKASPDDPPLSVNLLCKLAQQRNGWDCSLVSHVHSSWLGEVPDALLEFFSTTCSKDSKVCVRFIWKTDVLSPNLMVSVARQSPILGEANILRYLARAFLPQLYSDHKPQVVAVIDDCLNSALNASSPKDGKRFIQDLNVHLGKSNWISGDALSIADIFCSVVLLKHAGHLANLPKSVANWMAQCKKEIPGFDQVEKLCQ